MSVTVKYKDNTIAELSESGTKTLKTGGKYCEGDITVEHTKAQGADLSPFAKIATGTFILAEDTQKVTITTGLTGNIMFAGVRPMVSSLDDLQFSGVSTALAVTYATLRETGGTWSNRSMTNISWFSTTGNVLNAACSNLRQSGNIALDITQPLKAKDVNGNPITYEWFALEGDFE